jgi:ribose 5-phosphate isomerase A
VTETPDTAKRLAAEAAALYVEDGMTVGLGTGSTVAYLLPALAGRRLDIVCVATSLETQHLAGALGLHLRPFKHISRLDMAIDGSDQVADDFWLVKGGGGAHTREKIVAAAADRFVVIVSPEKLVQAVGGRVPVELLGFGLDATLGALRDIGEFRLRDAPLTPDGGVLADYFGPVDDPASLAARLAGTPGVVDHGLFPPEMVSEVLIGHAGLEARVERRARR